MLGTVGSLLVLGAGIYATREFLKEEQTLEDYLRHIYLIGGTGSGKTSKILSDIFLPWITGEVTLHLKQKPGALVIETKDKESADDILNSIPESEHDRVIVFDPYDMLLNDRYIGLNIVEQNYKLATVQTLVGGETISIFKRNWEGSIGPSSEDIIRNTTLAVLETEEPTILEVYRMIKDKEFREKTAENLENIILKDYFLNDFPDPAKNTSIFNPPLNKERAFLTDPLALAILAQKKGLNFREIIDSGKILVCCLPKGLIGEPLSKLLASIIISKTQLAAFSRSDIPKNERLKRPFMVVCDEFQDYCNSSFNVFLEQARSMGICLVLSHQLLRQEGVNESMIDSILGNVGTKYIFNLGVKDAPTLARELRLGVKNEPFNETALTRLPNFTCIAKKIVNGKRKKPIKIKSPLPPPKGGWADDLRRISREKYGVDYKEIERDIRERLKINEPEIIEIEEEVRFGKVKRDENILFFGDIA